MPPKRRKFESTFPAARIKKIMQLDDDVGRVASSVPVVISRAVEIFLQALLTRGADYATTRNAKTLTVGHLKHCIEQEKQWDFLRELTAKISDVVAREDSEESTGPKRGRKRKGSPLPGGSPVGAGGGGRGRGRGRGARGGGGGGRGRRKQKMAADAGEEDSEGSGEEGVAGTSVGGVMGGAGDHQLGGRGMFSQYFNQPSSSSSRSSSVASASPLSHGSRQPVPSSSSSAQPSLLSTAPPSLLSLSSHPPTGGPSDSHNPSSVELLAMTAGLQRGRPGEEEEEDDYDDEDE